MVKKRGGRKNKKGTEKPIEIFIALFIILAVSLLVLRLFQGQISRTTEDLGKAQLEAEIQANKNRFVQACSDACTEASSKGCTEESLVQLCVLTSAQVLGPQVGLDLDNNQMIGYNTISYGGIGVCEQNIPCFMEQTNCCNRRINLDTCKEILCDYWSNRGITNPETEHFAAVGYTEDSFNACNQDETTLAFWNGFNATC